MLLIPYGLDEMRLQGLPRATIAILALNVLFFAGQVASSRSAEVEARLEELVVYWADHPDLEDPPELEARTGLTRDRVGLAVAQPRRGAGRPVAPGRGDPERLAELAGAFADALESTPERTWGLVPAKGLIQPGWLTSLFLHGDLGHLLGNMLIFLLVAAPFLEQAWGWAFFLGLYLVGGIAAGAAQALPDLDSTVPIIGASGAISACLGAFALRFAHRRVRMVYWFLIFVRGSFFVPAWAYAFLGFGMDLLALSMGGHASRVAYAAHVGGFLFGVLVAVAVRATGLEDRLAPEGAARWGASLDASRASEALAAGDVIEARRHLSEAVARRPDDEASLLALARIEAARFERTRATELVERLLQLRLAAGDAAGGRAILAELATSIEPRQLKPATAFRAAELVAATDPALAEVLDETAAAVGGSLAMKALLRAALRSRATAPDRARDHLERALGLEGALPELRSRAEALLADLPPRALEPDRAIALDDDEPPGVSPPWGRPR